MAEVDDITSSQAADAAVDTQIAMLQSPGFMEHAFDVLSLDERLKEAVPRLSEMERRLKVIQELRSRLIAISFSAKSPSVAADVANKIARLYVEDPLLQSVQSVDDAYGQLSPRIRTLEAEFQRVTNKAATKKPDESTESESPGEEAMILRDQIASLRLSEALARRRQETRQQALAMSPPVQLVALATPPTRRSSINPVLIAFPGRCSRRSSESRLRCSWGRSTSASTRFRTLPRTPTSFAWVACLRDLVDPFLAGASTWICGSATNARWKPS